ncbi:hypothetical protein BJV77DRAFT_960396 [Russula vinacea]|nr:hypothetical protein BJV77DRAFT_960396 [Russula vinacea]
MPVAPINSPKIGAAILDVHVLRLTSRSPLGAGGNIVIGSVRRLSRHTKLLFTGQSLAHRGMADFVIGQLVCGSGNCWRILFNRSLSSAADSEVPTSHDHTRFQEDPSPFIKLSRNLPVPSRRNSGRSAAVVVEIDIPSILICLSKQIFDSLQFWVDDVSQLLERTMTASGEVAQENSSRDPSLVGSRFFSASKQGSVDTAVDEASAGHIKSSTESIVKVTISEDPGSMRLLVPRIEGEFQSIEPFDVFLSDVDILLESKPDGKDETVVTLSIMRASVQDASNPFPHPVLSLAAPHSLVFESVIPSERTRITVKIEEGSARLFAPRHTGAFVLHLGDVELATEVAGDSPEIRLRVAGRALKAFFTDNHLEAYKIRVIEVSQTFKGHCIGRLSSIVSIFAFISVLIQDPLWGCTLVILEQRLKQNTVDPGLRELDDDDLDMDDQSRRRRGDHQTFDPNGLHVVENFFNTLSALVESSPQLAEELDRVVVREGDITLFLYEGYDWATTRKVIEDEVKKMKRRLIQIKQLVASGQAYDPSIDPTNTLLFNSIHVGLDEDADEMAPDALIAAIDEELGEDNDTASVSSWQSLQPASSGRPNIPHPRLHGRRLTRSRNPSIEFHLTGVFTETVKFAPNDEIVSRTFATVKDVEILDHVKTSTWRKFLTALRSDRVLRGVHPVPGKTLEETRLRVKILPLRLHVDQDALDFLKKFFNFVNPNIPIEPESKSEAYIQRAEVYPVVLKLDYKPRRVDYRALREGRTIELMNFFHFDGAEMTLRHLTLFGVAGWPRFFDMLNDLWTPDVKATQLADVVSGVAPIRSVVNVGSGVADLVLLPIAQYRKDGRVVRGLQKGTKAFVRSTAMEAVKLGAQLATGTQVILEQAENVLGSKFSETILAETLPHPSDDALDRSFHSTSDEETTDPISSPNNPCRPYGSFRTFWERGMFYNTHFYGPVRAVIRAVPIAVLRPMIGASEAVSKTLLGLHNSMDPEIRHENAAKYKHR